eukprot:scaffold1523_cov426-Prasinococcus_capsulatus_cf.AAC.2
MTVGGGGRSGRRARPRPVRAERHGRGPGGHARRAGLPSHIYIVRGGCVLPSPLPWPRPCSASMLAPL